MSDTYYTTELSSVKDATADLIAKNAEYLIQYVYDHRNTIPYNHAEIRIGLVIKTLLKASGHFSSVLMTPVVDDIMDLVHDTVYLKTFPLPDKRKQALMNELTFINKYIQLDDLVSLNTLNGY